MVSARLIASLLVLLPCLAQGQAWPTKPIRLVSTFQAGEPADGVMRLMAQKIGAALGQPVVLDPLPGAGGIVGGQTVMRAAPDGHTFLYTLAAGLMTAPLLLKDRPYDALKDFSHVTHAMDGVTGLMVSTSLPIDSMHSLIEYVRANPGRLAYGSNGIGSNFHLEMEQLKSRVSGLDVTHVPFKVSTGAVQALIAGQIPVALSPVAIGLPHARAGKLRIIAILDSKRYAGLPDIPSMAEQVPGYERPPSGMRVFGPAGVPPAIVRRFQSEISAALAAPETQARLREIHFGAVGNTPEQFTAQMRREMDILARALQLAGLKPE